MRVGPRVLGACLLIVIARGETAGQSSTASKASTASTAAPAVTSEWIDFECIDESALPIVRVALNRSGGHRLVLDVGFNDFVLDTLIVDGTGLKLPGAGEAVIDYYGKKEKVPVVALDELKIGGLEFRNVRTLLIEDEDETGRGGLRSYGRIGRDLLEPLRLTVHYPRRLLMLEPSPASEVPPGGASLSSSGRFLLVPVTLTWEKGSEEVPFILDAGTSSTLIDRKWAVERGIAEKGAHGVKIPKVRIAGFELESLPVVLGEMKVFPYETFEGRAVGVLGADVLLGLAVTYDFARDLVWFVTAKQEPS
jgi:hypothetical protein